MPTDDKQLNKQKFRQPDPTKIFFHKVRTATLNKVPKDYPELPFPQRVEWLIRDLQEFMGIVQQYKPSEDKGLKDATEVKDICIAAINNSNPPLQELRKVKVFFDRYEPTPENQRTPVWCDIMGHVSIPLTLECRNAFKAKYPQLYSTEPVIMQKSSIAGHAQDAIPPKTDARCTLSQGSRSL